MTLRGTTQSRMNSGSQITASEQMGWNTLRCNPLHVAATAATSRILSITSASSRSGGKWPSSSETPGEGAEDEEEEDDECDRCRFTSDAATSDATNMALDYD
mmetsp:Transcript_565/g.1114  ORF Transcript_565/g.1114 Transcript_565/m.1114 type:complete len:102 (+) Transcript_565:767-1072(+)